MSYPYQIKSYADYHEAYAASINDPEAFWAGIADRIQDAQANTVITCDGAFRGNKVIPLKSTIDDALPFCPSIKKVIVYTHTRTPVKIKSGRL